MSALATLDALREKGYRTTLDRTELVVRGPGPVPEDLRAEIRADATAVKAAVLLNNPPPWLSKLLDLWRDGTETMVSRTNPTTGKVEDYPVRVQTENVVAMVGAAIGMDRLEWGQIRRPVVEEVLEREGA